MYHAVSLSERSIQALDLGSDTDEQHVIWPHMLNGCPMQIFLVTREYLALQCCMSPSMTAPKFNDYFATSAMCALQTLNHICRLILRQVH